VKFNARVSLLIFVDMATHRTLDLIQISVLIVLPKTLLNSWLIFNWPLRTLWVIPGVHLLRFVSL
jgi:hypothetical protein